MVDVVIDNCLDWYTGDKTVTGTFSQRKFVNKITKYAQKYPGECHINFENEDGSIVATFPLSWLKIHRPAERTMTEEQKKTAAKRLMKGREKKNAI